MSEEMHLVQASVFDVDQDGNARINCATKNGKQVTLHLSRETLVLLCSSATRELRTRDRKRDVQRRSA